VPLSRRLLFEQMRLRSATQLRDGLRERGTSPSPTTTPWNQGIRVAASRREAQVARGAEVSSSQAASSP
jgi:hypothetical protein